MTQRFLLQLAHLMKIQLKTSHQKLIMNYPKLTNCSKLTKLSLNKSKTKYMISKKQRANIVKPILQIDGINIESVDHFNFLGLTLDSRMTWNNHTTNIQINAQELLAY